MKPQLIFCDENKDTVNNLRQSFEGCPELTALLLKPDQLPKLEGLDALYLSLPYAERWGSRPILYKAQVLKTHPEDEGMPPYIVTGVAMHEDQLRDPRFELRLIISAVLDAVEAFNLENVGAIQTIGFWIEMLGAQRLDSAETGQIIKSMYEEKRAIAA